MWCRQHSLKLAPLLYSRWSKVCILGRNSALTTSLCSPRENNIKKKNSEIFFFGGTGETQHRAHCSSVTRYKQADGICHRKSPSAASASTANAVPEDALESFRCHLLTFEDLAILKTDSNTSKRFVHWILLFKEGKKRNVMRNSPTV